MSPPVRLLKTVRLLETLEYLRTDVLSNNLSVSALLAWKSEISILYNTFLDFYYFQKRWFFAGNPTKESFCWFNFQSDRKYI